MPNPGFIRYIIGVVGIVAGGYQLATGEELPKEIQDQLSGGIDSAYLAYTLFAAGLGAIYSKLVPSGE